MDLKSYIRDIPDFPKKGIIYKDITTLLKNKEAFSETINIFYKTRISHINFSKQWL